MPERNHQHRRGCLLLATALLVLIAGCDRSVIIQQPLSGTYKSPVTTLAVQFHPEFQPGTFRASLSGTTITNLFHPTPAPGGVSTATVEYPNFMDRDYNFNQQLLVVEGDFTTSVFYFFGIPTRFTRDTSTFTPPSVMVYRGRTSFNNDLDLKERETIIASAYVEEAPKERLLVTITGNTLVSLNDHPAGENIQVWIERNDRRADFTVRGIQSGTELFRIRGIATGYSSGVAGGTVQRNP